ncbi:MAG: hypothetical protein K1060chlam2_00080 [Chlamydiae bacterium]|nr:hypothetical protein [Chlamydiota bacterium]
MTSPSIDNSSSILSSILNTIGSKPKVYGRKISQISRDILDKASIDLASVNHLQNLLSKRRNCLLAFEAPFKTELDVKTMVLNKEGLSTLNEIRATLYQWKKI